jgi:quercetin dioxygenase-like cupin family protein
MTDLTTRAPYARTTSNEHTRLYLGQHLLTFLANGEDTEGRFSLRLYHGRKGGEPPPHIHTLEDESFYVIDGEVTVKAGGHTFRVRAATWVTVPRNTEHAFTIESPEVRMLTHFTPAGFERYFLEMSEPAEPSTLPTSPVGSLDVERIREVASKYGCVFPDAPPFDAAAE